MSKKDGIQDVGEVYRLRDRVEFLENKVRFLEADLAAIETATLARYKYASDAEITAWANEQPNIQAKKIADLTFRLAREQAKSEEVGKANSLLITRLQMKRKQMTEAEFGQQIEARRG